MFLVRGRQAGMGARQGAWSADTPSVCWLCRHGSVPAPARGIRGPLTGSKGPRGVALANDEIWVANFGDHTAVVFPRLASGNVAPRRILRNAPAGRETSGFGNPYAVAYDSKRQEVLVP